jgi:hypothetical protein
MANENCLTFKAPCKGLSSIKPNDAGDELDGSQEVPCGAQAATTLTLTAATEAAAIVDDS